MFALAFSYVNSRGGKSGGMIAAFLVYFIYSNFLNYAVAAVQKGEAKTSLMIWSIHFIFGCLAFFFIYRRNQNLNLLPSLYSKAKLRVKTKQVKI